MDAIESGIVKLPRVPVSDDVSTEEMPRLRNLWEHIGKKMPKKGRSKSAAPFDPEFLPALLETAASALYTHYERTFGQWRAVGITTPPVFIVVCNNTATSKLLYDYFAGFQARLEDGSPGPWRGGFERFRNYDEEGNRLARPRTLLIDSQQIESGDALDRNFREAAKDQIARFRREIIERTGNREEAEAITDSDLLREAMNTVGKPGRLGEDIRCVVSVSMLTEGWDANTVTHILGVRAFGTQLLCEQVVGRVLRRQSYEAHPETGLFDPEYADVLGVPFDFTAKPTVVPPARPRLVAHVHAVRPERDGLEIRFPRVEGYRMELPDDRLEARFSPDSTLTLTHEMVGPGGTTNQGIIGLPEELQPDRNREIRTATLAFHLTRELLRRHLRGANEEPKLHLFGQVKRIVRLWLDGGYLRCEGRDAPRAGSLRRDRGARLRKNQERHLGGTLRRATAVGGHRSLQPGRLHGGGGLPDDEDRSLAYRPREVPRELRGLRRRLGTGVLPDRREGPAGQGLREERRARVRGPLPPRRTVPPLLAGLHRRGGERRGGADPRRGGGQGAA